MLSYLGFLRKSGRKKKKAAKKGKRRQSPPATPETKASEDNNNDDDADDSNHPPLASPCSSTGTLDAIGSENGATDGGVGPSKDGDAAPIPPILPQEDNSDLASAASAESLYFFDAEEQSLKASSPPEREEANDGGGDDDKDDDDVSVAESFRSCVEDQKPPIAMVGTFSLDTGVVIEREAGRTEDVVPSGGVSVVSSVSSSSFRTAFDDARSSCGSAPDLGLPLTPKRLAMASSDASAASSATDASFATALSRMSSKTDKVFVSMPRRLIRSGHEQQALSVLGDDRYIVQRIQKLGVVLAAELMTSDLDCFQKRVHKLKAAHGREQQGMDRSFGMGLMDNFSQVSSTGTTSSVLQLFDVFQRQVVSSCRSYLLPAAATSTNNGALMSPSEGGKALYMLGTSLDKRGIVNKAMNYYRHALGLFLAPVSDVGISLFDDTRRELGLGSDVSYEKIGDSANSSDGQELEYQDIGLTLAYVGDLHAKNGQLDDALQAYSAALAHFDRAVTCLKADIKKMRANGENVDSLVGQVTTVRTEFLWTLFRMGTCHGERNDLPASIATYQRALMLEASLLGHDAIEVADTNYNLGVLFSRQGNLDQAVKHYEEALEIRRSVLGPKHADVARTLYNVGGIHRRRKDFKKAIQCFQEIIDTQESVLGKEHPLVKLTTISLAATLRRSEEKEKAWPWKKR